MSHFSVRLVCQLQSGLRGGSRGEEAGAGHHQVCEDSHEDPPHLCQLSRHLQEAHHGIEDMISSVINNKSKSNDDRPKLLRDINELDLLLLLHQPRAEPSLGVPAQTEQQSVQDPPVGR